MEQPSLVEDVDLAEGLVARVCAIDIAKATGMVCVRLPHENVEGRRVQRTWTVAATTNAILELADHLVCQSVTRVVMEATGAYGKPWFYLLEARGLSCWLVNARQVKNVPGRPKTDKLDAIWLAKLTERGMLSPSFVPPEPIRQLRDPHPHPHRLHRRTLPPQTARGEDPRRRPNQAVHRGYRHLRGLRPGHAGRDDRRTT
jgi:hypothetical protein